MTNRKSQAKPAKTEHSTGREAPAWKTSWPRGGDLRAWLRCMLRKCEAIVDIDDAASNAHFPIEGLHGLGHTKEAIRYVHRFLKRLPSTANVETVRMHELAAEIHLSAGDDAATEKHLGAFRSSIIQERESATATSPRKPCVNSECDTGF